MESNRANVYYKTKDFEPAIQNCVYLDDYTKFISEIDKDQRLTAHQKRYLVLLASRFIVFRYEKIADYYAQADDHMKEWLEKLRCVIVDKDKAIQNGYFKYMEDYEKLLGEVVNEGE